MATGPVVGYLHQYYIISKSKSVGTFSIDICGILLFANILRLNFFVFEKYELSLFFQSIIMVIAQICLVHICTKYWQKINQIGSQSSSQSNFGSEKSENLDNFWRWKLFSTYLLFIVFFTFVTFSTTIIFFQLQMNGYGVMIGLVALLSESILILPQILKNCKNQSTKGLSYVLVGLNLFGDIFKLVYFILKAQPFQFILCGVIQVCLDSFVIIQIFWYKRRQFHEDKQDRPLSPKYSIKNEIKPQTQKNFDQVQMQNMPPVFSEVQDIFKFQPIDGFVIQNEQITPKQGKDLISDNPQRQKAKTIIEQKIYQEVECNENQVKSPEFLSQNDKNSILETNPSEVLSIKKTQSYQPSTASSQSEFFKNSFSNNAKSLQKIEIQC